MSPGIDTHFGAFGRSDFADNWECSADKVTLLVGTQAELELLEDETAVVLTAFRLVPVEDHRLGLGSLLHCTGRSGTLLKKIPQSQHCKGNKTEGYCVLGRGSCIIRDHLRGMIGFVVF